MAYALMALMAIRELYRHIAKMAGWVPRFNSRRNHLMNALFAASGLGIALGNLFSAAIVTTIGWSMCGTALLGGTMVPCGWGFVNTTPAVWYFRQLLFVCLGMSAFACAFSVLS